MYYAIGKWHDAEPNLGTFRDDFGWWERLCGPNTNVHACARNLGKFLVRSTPTNPRSGYALLEFLIVMGAELPNYGLPIPDAVVEQAQFQPEGE